VAAGFYAWYPLITPKKMRKEILVVDPSKAIRFMLHTILRKHYKVTSVADGVSAIYSLRKHAAPDLIIMNPSLSDFPEWELVKYLKGSHLYSSIPVMVLCDKSDEMASSNVIKYTVEELFVKPFNPLKLLESVDTMLIGNNVSRIF
jgi:DNA-binding response OmpR family regulator